MSGVYSLRTCCSHCFFSILYLISLSAHALGALKFLLNTVSFSSMISARRRSLSCRDPGAASSEH